MNKQEILNEIEKTKEHLANMEKMLEEYKYKRWKPKDCEKYWYADYLCNVNYTLFYTNVEVDNNRYSTYNCFKTEEEAEAEAEKILIRRKLEDIARRLNKSYIVIIL